MNCRHCDASCIRKGKQNDIQIYQCKACLKYQRISYKYQSKYIEDSKISQLIKEGVGIRSIARILAISPSTGIPRILKIAKSAKRPHPIPFDQTYQVNTF